MNTIRVTTTIESDMQKVWDMWTDGKHIKKWNHASEDWECPFVENNLTIGGKFLFRMSAKDGSASFDFTGTYNKIVEHSLLSYTMDDGRNASVLFEKISDNEIKVTEVFDQEMINSTEIQRNGWQAILTNFKEYVEVH
jgi:uncharacterized protein YndB with AHSA1/START domain